MADQLVQVPIGDWQRLRDLCLHDWPKYIIGYTTLDTFIRWTVQNPQIEHVNVYSVNGDWSDGTFLAIRENELSLNTLGSSLDRLTRGLMLLDWTNNYRLRTLEGRLRPAVLRLIEAKRLTIEFDFFTHLYHIPKEAALQLNDECPSGVTLAPLSVSKHAERIDAVWPNRYPGSLKFLSELIELNLNLGAFDESGKLLAWCLRHQAGSLGILQVEVEHKKQGLGRLVCVALTKKLAKLGLSSTACITDTNVASRGLFESVGYSIIGEAYQMGCRHVPGESID